MNKRLKAKIIERFGTQADFARAMNVDELLVSRIVRGRRELEQGVQILWGKVLKCDPKELFRDES